MTKKRESMRPYVGPRPYETRDREKFFGRERETDDLVALVIGNPVVVLYAQSGAGKTSLLNASVIPRLTEQGFETMPVARLSGIVPESVDAKSISNVFVFNTLLSWVRNVDCASIDSLVDATMESFLHSELGQGLVNPRDDEPALRVFVFDQFEELFTTQLERWEEREPFFEQLRDVASDPLNRVILALREDFVAELDRYAEFLPDRLRARYRMQRLSKAQSLAAVTRPLLQTDRTFEAGVAEALVDELLLIRVETANGETMTVRGDSVEPVQLQVVCDGLWTKLPAAVTQIRQVHRKKYANVDEALSNFYLGTVNHCAEISGVPRALIREWCGGRLITSSGTRGIVHRGAERTADLSNEAVECLEGKHLIRSERRAGARWYELTHDRFIDAIQNANSRLTAERGKAISYLEKAQKMALEKEYERALLACENALKIGETIGDPSVVKWAYELKGWICHEYNDIECAVEAYQKALPLAAQFDSADDYRLVLLEYGSVLREMDVSSALGFFEQLATAMPEDATVLSELAKTYFSLGRFNAATGRYELACELEPNNPELRVDLGVCLLAEEDLQEAEKRFFEALEIEPKTVSAHSNLGVLYDYQGRIEEAESHFQKALIMDPRNADALVGLATRYAMLGRNKEAISAYERAVKIQPFDRETLEGLAYEYRHAKRYDESIAMFERIVGSFPDYAHAHIGLGGVYRRKKEIEKAVVEYQLALSLDGGNPLARASLAFCYRKLGDESQFKEEVDRALADFDEEWADDVGNYNVACFYALCGQVELAVEHLKKALEGKEESLEAVSSDIDFELIRESELFKEALKLPKVH